MKTDALNLPGLDEIEEFYALNQQLAELEKKIAAMRPRVLNRARVVVAQMMAQNGFDPDDVIKATTKRTLPGAGVAKYQDPVSGDTWSGMGRIPYWIRGKVYSEFLIEKPVAAEQQG
jgi:DNA-binding protein H-NS